jgi:hypothetical protein
MRFEVCVHRVEDRVGTEAARRDTRTVEIDLSESAKVMSASRMAERGCLSCAQQVGIEQA